MFLIIQLFLVEVTDELDLELLSQTSCRSNCSCKCLSSSQTDHKELEVI